MSPKVQKSKTERLAIRLTEEESRRFEEILSSPPREPTQEAWDALKNYRETVIER